jgi:hypothetical protein
MAKNVRIVPSSGSIYFTADGYDVTGSIRLQTVGRYRRCTIYRW